ncbi:MAG: hypothetical protein R2942_08615 [Ignavibacteria bacterium]
MCGYANIEAVSISGVAKNVFKNEIICSVPPGSNHQWSAAKIYGNGILLI